jgi:hypothetical protein
MFKLLGKTETKELSLLNNPFTQNGVECIVFVIQKGAQPGAVVDFKNGDTMGKQVIKSDSFSSLVAKVEAFVQSLSQ